MKNFYNYIAFIVFLVITNVAFGQITDVVTGLSQPIGITA